VDVVHPVAGPELEHLVGLVLRAPAFAEHVRGDLRVGLGTPDVVVEQVGEIVVRAGRVRRQQPHVRGSKRLARMQRRFASPGPGCSASSPTQRREAPW
jgi:hypothetical protein